MLRHHGNRCHNLGKTCRKSATAGKIVRYRPLKQLGSWNYFLDSRTGWLTGGKAMHDRCHENGRLPPGVAVVLIAALSALSWAAIIGAAAALF